LPVAIAPGLLRVPAWIAVDATLGIWWAVFALVFATLLYRGSRVAEDGPSLADARPTEGDDTRPRRKRSPLLDGCGDLGGGCSGDFGGAAVGEGCGGGIVGLLGILAALAALVLLAWLLAEFVLPLLFTAAYYLVSRGLRRVANDTHDCQGDLLR